ncbi:hypothetical protein ABIE65_005608, partial [Constrictibacter sp. MBR-5]|uniref:hypothetical protein n=1 Tax=Constrictibacter sp. MBR-5 TaxID=3156467 RepID=UPI0033933A73
RISSSMECNVLEAETPLQNDGEISTPYLTISMFMKALGGQDDCCAFYTSLALPCSTRSE